MISLRHLKRGKVFHIDEKLKIPRNLPDTLSAVLHENTKLHSSDVRPWLVPAVPPGLSAMSPKVFFQNSAHSYKIYEGYPEVPLEGRDEPPEGASLWQAIKGRRSVRDYGERPVGLNDLARLLYFSYGETGSIETGENPIRLRAAPSAGALYPLDIYPMVCRVKDLEKGLYHYNVRDHSLECLNPGDHINQVYPLVQPENNVWLKTAGIILFITATFKRNQLKYGERGYRGVLFDAGHLSQNILLTSRAMGYGTCVIMACLDDPVNDFLGIDGVEESVLLAIAIGSPAREGERHEQ